MLSVYVRDDLEELEILADKRGKEYNVQEWEEFRKDLIYLCDRIDTALSHVERAAKVGGDLAEYTPKRAVRVAAAAEDFFEEFEQQVDDFMDQMVVKFNHIAREWLGLEKKSDK